MLKRSHLIASILYTCMLPFVSLQGSSSEDLAFIHLKPTKQKPASDQAANQLATSKEQENREPIQEGSKKGKSPTHYNAFIEGKIAYFRPKSSKIRDIYDRGIPMTGLEISAKACPYLYPWASVSYLQQIGHTPIFHSRSEVKLVPIGFGFKFLYDFKPLSIYAGAGPLISYIQMKDYSRYVIPSSSKWAWGGIGKIGVLFFPIKHFSIDVFADYSYMKFDFSNGYGKVVRTDVDFSGWSVGGAIGYAF